MAKYFSLFILGKGELGDITKRGGSFIVINRNYD